MYRWQTLTLARLESAAAAHKTTDGQIQCAKRLLLDIGIRHFFEPRIDYDNKSYPRDADGIWLTWAVDDRKFVATINCQGRLLLSNCPRPFGAEPPQSARDAVHYLLNGPSPVKANSDPGEGGLKPRGPVLAKTVES